MTRASLLHILDHVGSISEDENQELVQLATAFPYCQTAHLLLAKAAHDKGSMLASQRLRRAATYAADRQLLRLLIEQPSTLLPAAGPTLPDPELAAEPQRPLPSPTPTDVLAISEIPAAAAPESLAPTADAAPTPATTEPQLLSPLTSADEETPGAATAEPAPTLAAEAAPTPAPAESPAPVDDLPESAAALAAAELPAAEEPPAATTIAEAIDKEGVTAASAAAAVPDDLLPAAAPPIRPPADAGSSRFEFGLADAAAPAPAVYELLDAEPTAAALPPARTAASPAFYTDPTLGYGLDLGSRLGASLQRRDACTTDLPPTEFFLPDALLLAHIEAHQPTLPAPRKTLAIIDQFLKNKPRLKAPPVAPPAEEQADLSVPSTSATPALASESLAKIMVKQGKTAKAIEIYECLIVRQPEKKAYFADQIAQLKSSE